jgi:hypothetical protein
MSEMDNPVGCFLAAAKFYQPFLPGIYSPGDGSEEGSGIKVPG